MKQKARNMEHVVVQASFAESEEMDVAFYASLKWNESVLIVEEMRMNVWSEAYEEHKGVEKIIRKAALTSDRDDFK